MFFYKEIIEVAEKTFVIKFPDELVGKTVEIIAFEIEEDNNSDTTEKTVNQ